MVSVVILTFNSERTIGQTLDGAFAVSDDVQVVDSFSSDATCEIVRRRGAHLVQHPFENYGAQRNWAIANLRLRYPWQLHLDADEYLTPELIEEIKATMEHSANDVNGYFIPRLTRFLGRDLRHGGLFPIWHMRLFRTGKGRCEERRYDQHFFVEGGTGKLRHAMIDDHRMPLAEWTARHNRWSDAEAAECLAGPAATTIRADIKGSPVQRKRALRGWYYSFPLLFRPFCLFFYRYVLRLGFLDGIPGLIYIVLQTFWFRFLIDAKLVEAHLQQEPAHVERDYKQTAV